MTHKFMTRHKIKNKTYWWIMATDTVTYPSEYPTKITPKVAKREAHQTKKFGISIS